MFYFFLLPQGNSPNATRYQHPAIALAEGFASLGIPFTSNIDHWPSRADGPPLFRADPGVDPYSCDAVFVTSDWVQEGRPIPTGLFEGPDRPVSVYFDHEDGSRLHSLDSDFPKFDIVLRSHFGAEMPYPASFHPWAFGLSNRIIESTASNADFGDRDHRLLVSYRHTRYPHGARTYMDKAFLAKLGDRLPVVRYEENDGPSSSDPVSEHLWRMTGRRHSSRYYDALRDSVASACFGGYFITQWPRNERLMLSRFLKNVVKRFGLATNRITQFDSWRFWESFAASTATIHFDLSKYGAILPEMPTNWEHYIGVDVNAIERDIQRMLVEPSIFENIGFAGRAWALTHYAPRPTAERFLRLLNSANRLKLEVASSS